MKPKGKTPSLLVQSTGMPEVYDCKKATNCYRCKSSIRSGARAFKIPKAQSGFTNKKPCCRECFSQILEQTKSDIAVLEKMLSGD